MQAHIEELYGDYFAQEADPRHRQELSRLWQAVEGLEEKLERGLSEEMQGLFREYKDKMSRCSFLEGRNEFVDGFRLGGKMVLEILEP